MTADKTSAPPTGAQVHEQRYLDDFRIGEVFHSPERTLRREDFAKFSEITGDKHPIHSDDDYARSRGMPGAAAHGLHLLAACALGAAPIAEAMNASMIAMAGSSARYRKPAIAGDVLHPEFEVVAVEPKDEKRGLLRLAVRLYNQRRELLLEGEHQVMLARRAGDRG